jgi:HTH-type transcriptional regulator, sugar sensing transcriptional regulator
LNLEEILEKIGLSRRESLIYLHLLKSGPLSPTHIADKTGIKRPNVYDSLKSLETKGLIHYQLKNKRRLIAASSPKNLFDITEQRFELAKKVLPILQSMDREQSFESNISFYQGRKGLRELMNEYPKAKSKDVWFLVSPQDTNKLLGKEFIERLIQERVKRGTKLKSLRPADKESIWEGHKTDEGRQLTEAAYVPPEYSFSLSVGVYDDVVVVLSSKREGFGFRVESKEFAEVMRMFYDIAWKNSGKLNSSED